MAWEARSGLKRDGRIGLGEPQDGLNGLGSPFGFETLIVACDGKRRVAAKWPGMPVRV